MKHRLSPTSIPIQRADILVCFPILDVNSIEGVGETERSHDGVHVGEVVALGGEGAEYLLLAGVVSAGNLPVGELAPEY